MSEDYLNDEDLLSLLEDSVKADESKKDESNKSEEISPVEKAMTQPNRPTIDTAVSVKDLTVIAEKLSDATGNVGSGNLDADLSNWFDGTDALPSDPLNQTVSNASLKLDYGLTHSTLSSFKLMGKLRKFIEDDAFDMLFTETAILGLDSEEILDRVKVAFTMYKELGQLNQRVISSMKDYRLKSNSESSETDRLTMLLNSIPSDKLRKVLDEIAYGEHANK